MSTPCPKGTIGNQRGARSEEDCDECASRIERYLTTINSGSTKCDACWLGYFDEATSTCATCPENAFGLGAGKRFRCLCEVGLYMFQGECKRCPLPGTSCTNETGVTLSTLPLEDGFWRPSNSSSDIRPCPDVAGGSASGCGGGVPLCKEARGLTGVYCRTCTNSSAYYVSSECRPCAPLIDRWTAVSLGVAFGGLALVLFGAWLWSRKCARKRLRTLRKQAAAKLWRAVRRFSLTSKIKVVWGFLQVVGNMRAVCTSQGLEPPVRTDRFAIHARALPWTDHLNTLPDNVGPILDAFEIGISIGFDGLGSLLGCVGLSSEVNALAFYMIAPPLVMLIASVSSGAMLWAASRRRGDTFWVHKALLATLRPVLLISFCAYPIVASVAFQAFACEPLEDVSMRYLPPDYSLECGPEGEPTDEYKRLTNVAIVAIILYPVGISVTTALLLYIARVPLRAGLSTDFTQAISFLHEEYELTFFWWELVEQLKKLLLVGFAVFITPGSLSQLVFGLLVGLFFFLFTIECRPYLHSSDNSLAGVPPSKWLTRLSLTTVNLNSPRQACFHSRSSSSFLACSCSRCRSSSTRWRPPCRTASCCFITWTRQSSQLSRLFLLWGDWASVCLPS